jgi:hypothetical protein
MANQSQARSTAASDPDVDGWRKRQPRADEFQPSLLTHEVGGCDHQGTEGSQR